MVVCKACGQVMTSAPSHMEHERECVRHNLWEAIRTFVVVCGGDPDMKGASRASEERARQRVEKAMDLL